MKKALMLGLAVGMLFAATTAQAAGNHPMAGCGLAYQLYAADMNSPGIQILASTTNNSSGTQTFGITSGTSGCVEDGTVKLGKEVEVFAAYNLNNLAEEMAKGSGEYVTAFASLLGADEATQPALVALFQEKYEVLFPTEETTAIEMLDALKVELAEHPELLL